MRVSDGVRMRAAVLRKATFLYLSNGDACGRLLNGVQYRV